MKDIEPTKKEKNKGGGTESVRAFPPTWYPDESLGRIQSKLGSKTEEIGKRANESSGKPRTP